MRLKRRLRALAAAIGCEARFERLGALARLDPRRLRRAASFRWLNRDVAAGEIALRAGLRLRIDPRSREPFEWFCFRSPAMAAELDTFLRHRGAHTRLLDLGACHGIFSLAFVHGRPAARAVAVEPSPEALDVLERNIGANAVNAANAGNAAGNGSGAVVIARVAVGDGNGTLRMRRNWHHLEALPEGQGGAGDLVVPMRTLDDLCADLDFHPDLVKIDVEGCEHAVLRGARGLLSRERPHLFLEVHPSRLLELGSSSAMLARFLADQGYRFYSVGGRALGARELASRESVFRLLCVPAAAGGVRGGVAGGR